jgi:hypothetical protein
LLANLLFGDWKAISIFVACAILDDPLGCSQAITQSARYCLLKDPDGAALRREIDADQQVMFIEGVYPWACSAGYIGLVPSPHVAALMRAYRRLGWDAEGQQAGEQVEDHFRAIFVSALITVSCTMFTPQEHRTG